MHNEAAGRLAVQDGQMIRLASGISLHYASAGQPGAPLVVFLHGFPQAWFAWETLLPLAASRHYCVAPDMRGFNRSDRPAAVADYRIDRLVRDMVELVHGLGYQDALFVAHDWGGAVAFSTAIAHPTLMRRLMILNAPHPVPFAAGLARDPAQQRASAYMNDLRAPDCESRLLADDCEALLSKFRSSPGDWLTPELAARYREAWRQPGALTGALNYYRASPLYPPIGDDPGAAALTLDPAAFIVRVPTTVVWGMDDTALLPTLLDGLDEWIPDLTIVRIPGASHWLIDERPDAIATQLLRFLE